MRVRITAVTLPGRQFGVARELRLRCATALTEVGIAAPVMETQQRRVWLPEAGSHARS